MLGRSTGLVLIVQVALHHKVAGASQLTLAEDHVVFRAVVQGERLPGQPLNHLAILEGQRVAAHDACEELDAAQLLLVARHTQLRRERLGPHASGQFVSLRAQVQEVQDVRVVGIRHPHLQQGSASILLSQVAW